MLTPELIAELIYHRLRATFGTSTQSQISTQLGLSQSIISRLLNQSYVISSRDNSVFGTLATYFQRSPDELWGELELEANSRTETDYAGRGKLSIGMASYAVYTAPFIHAFQKFTFPDWLRLGYVHHITRDDTGNRFADLGSPDWWDAANFHEKIVPNVANENDVRNPFLNCYTSEDLLDLIDSPTNDVTKRRFQAIFCPEISREYRTGGTNDAFTLTNGVELVKVAAICAGYGSLLIVASIEDKEAKTGWVEQFRDFTEDEFLKGYRIENEALPMTSINATSVADNKQQFLDHLEVNGKTPKFFLRGIDGTHSFDKFRELWEVKRPEVSDNEYKSKKAEYDKLQYLMATRGTINYTRDNTDIFQAIAAMMKEGKKLVLVAHPPYVHNSYQRIKQALADLPATKYVHQYRYNFSQWLGPQQYNLYISRSHLTNQNIRRINELLLQIEQSRASITHNDKLPDFFYYDPVIKKEDNATKISLETKFLFNLACQELAFDAQPPITYSATFMKLLLESSK